MNILVIEMDDAQDKNWASIPIVASELNDKSNNFSRVILEELLPEDFRELVEYMDSVEDDIDKIYVYMDNMDGGNAQWQKDVITLLQEREAVVTYLAKNI